MDWNVYWMDHRVEGLALASGPSAMATTQGVAVLPHLKQMVDIIAHGLQDMSNMSGILFEIALALQNSWNFVKVCSRFTLWVLWQDEQQKVRTITALALAALAEVRPRQTSLCLPLVCAAPTVRPRCLMALRPSIRCYDRCGRVSWRQFCTTDFVVDRFNLCMCWNFFKGMILQIEIHGEAVDKVFGTQAFANTVERAWLHSWKPLVSSFHWWTQSTQTTTPERSAALWHSGIG